MADIAGLKARILTAVVNGDQIEAEFLVNLLVGRLTDKENLVLQANATVQAKEQAVQAKEQAVHQASARADHLDAELMDARADHLRETNALHARGVMEALEAKNGKVIGDGNRQPFWDNALMRGNTRRLLYELAHGLSNEAYTEYLEAQRLESMGDSASMRGLCSRYATILAGLFGRLSHNIHNYAGHAVPIAIGNPDTYAIVAICNVYGVRHVFI